ncbi:decapping and exoribonuclease protein-like [Branchiostoma floridae]|uniref:Decapping nuclease n=1 Tax=Branchiostoma floridae TaxID=7739 RepID=A0A9J7LPG5_BRAFL|nr:decapping and exoribonuclease protein-like [Branchiostoma floridae]
MELPKQLGTFSVTSDGFFNDDRNLRSYKPVADRGRLDLDKGYDAKFVDYKDEEDDGDLDNILKWIKSQDPNVLAGVEFVTRRAILTKVMRGQWWKLAVTKFNGIWYISTTAVHEQKTGKQPSAEKQKGDKRKLYWGHKFEQYMTGCADSPEGEPNTVDLNEGFYTVVKYKLKSHSLLFSAEVDAIGETGSYVEFKTFAIPQKKDVDQEVNTKFKNCWVQSYLAGVDEIVFGIRRDDKAKGVVTESQTRKITDGKAEYDSDWKSYADRCDKFLSEVKDYVKEDNASIVYLYQHGQKPYKEPKARPFLTVLTADDEQ